MNDHPYQTLTSRIAYETPYLRVREDAIIRPDGERGVYSVVETADSVMIAAVNDSSEVFLVHTYSYPDQSWNWELPGGGSDGEDSAIAARRELAEETGILAQQWTPLGKTRVCNGIMTEKMSIYLACGLTLTGKKSHEDEALVRNGKFFPLNELTAMVQRGKVNDGQTLAGIYLLQQWLTKNN